METTLFLSKVVGPVLVLRAVSILIDRKHFQAMLDGLEREVETVSFSFFPIALLMAGIALAIALRDTSSMAAIIFRVIAWGAIVKAALLILFPRAMVAKARLLGQAGFLNVVWVAFGPTNRTRTPFQ